MGVELAQPTPAAAAATTAEQAQDLINVRPQPQTPASPPLFHCRVLIPLVRIRCCKLRWILGLLGSVLTWHWQAARYDDLEDVVTLFSAGVSLDSTDSQGRTALHMASANGHIAVVEYLIQNGANVNATNLEKNTPLHWACLNGHIEVIKALISAGASVSALNSHEKTPMDEAVTKGKMDVIDAIGAAVAQAELDGVTVS
ncbi:unnamed protein product [Urochloa decumbens]|uniref:Uncharacterized protein n=1 Tax=Urochloa decumbens TaxID=240449 RepID=A0ABC9F8E6_9POAL